MPVHYRLASSNDIDIYGERLANGPKHYYCKSYTSGSEGVYSSDYLRAERILSSTAEEQQAANPNWSNKRALTNKWARVRTVADIER